MIPQSLNELANQFTKYPGVGPRQAFRYALFVSKQTTPEIEQMIQTLKDLKHINLCERCFLQTENENSRCSICDDKKRNQNEICVVEREGDLINIEKSRAYRGTYVVLGENISPINTSIVPKQRLLALIKEVKKMPEEEKKEIILALNNTREGNFTTLYIEETFKKQGLKNLSITSLGRGLASGSELEYIDEETTRHAFEGRK